MSSQMIMFLDRGLAVRQIFIRSLVLLMLGTASPALAQGVVAGSGMPEFMLSSDWKIGPSGIEALRGMRGTKLPCVMAGEYNNGFVVRFSGGNNEMLAMAVDFRQDIFRQGARYGAQLSVDGGASANVTGSAFTPSILVFNLRQAGNIYGALAGARAMELSVGNNAMRFYLDNLNEGLQKLEACFQGGVSSPASSFDTASAPDALAMPNVNTPPTSLAEIQTQAPRQATPNWEDGLKNTPSGQEVYIPRNTKASAPVKQQSALPAMTADSTLTQPYDGVSSSPRYSAGMDASYAPVSLTDQGGATTGGRMGGSGGGLSAASGTSLKAALEQWSTQNGVTLIWNGVYNYPLKSAISGAASFESAVETALSQYQNDPQRPVGRLNTDPDTGARLLVIDTDFSL